MEESDRYCLNEPESKLISTELNNNSNSKMFNSNESLISGVSSVASSAGGLSPLSSVEFDLGGDALKGSDGTRHERSGSHRSLLGYFDDKDGIEIFPSLPDQDLERMGLMGDQTTRFQDEEELEQKFVALSLAFSIDSKTIKDRCARQRRSRDQTEKNFATEIERLTERVNRLTRLCIDKESTALLDALLTQIDIVVKASELASSSAERYGAVQHEERLSEAVYLMMNHVKSLKQQRDLSRKQLQYTKTVLQGNNTKEENSSREIRDVKQVPNNDRRRASIAIGTLKNPAKTEKTLTRRTSESGFKTVAGSKSPKISRMELGGDLVKIKEGMVEETSNDSSDLLPEKNITGSEESEDEEKSTKEIRGGVSSRFQVMQEKFISVYKDWNDRGTLSHVFYISALFCFCLALVVMADILFELEVSKR